MTFSLSFPSTVFNLVGTYLDGKICGCRTYAASYTCYRQCEGEVWGVACPPPSCRFCGGWPPQYVTRCQDCKEIFYAWFGPFVQPYEQNHGQYACWKCLCWPHREPPKAATWRHPPKCVLPNLDHLDKLFKVEL